MNNKIQFPNVRRIRDSYERNRTKAQSQFRLDMEQKLEDPQFVSALRSMLNNASI
jgi:hypothetical protein